MWYVGCVVLVRHAQLPEHITHAHAHLAWEGMTDGHTSRQRPNETVTQISAVGREFFHTKQEESEIKNWEKNLSAVQPSSPM